MKKLQTVNLGRLTNLEFGQHVKSVKEGITTLNVVSDAGFTNYLTQLETSIDTYDKALIQIRKSDETEKIAKADEARDTAISALIRYLKVFELAENEEEVLAYKSLNTLIKTYKNLQNWNFEEESNGIDNLVTDLNNAKYLPSVNLLHLNSYVTRVATRNDEFKMLFAGRTMNEASKEVFDVKKLRSDVRTLYTDMVTYVFAMAKSKDTDEFNQALNVLNTVRKYYADLLARRNTTSNNTPVDPIPLMQ
ncbi:DUF6261 family protein [Flavobacterium sp. J27]|uniref:DUF6261 family protein n=1 Tax=Flavobacterium sp. J27 TaxID=2060419 RepID=UPI00103159E2|nr:DUF6261 family protein [Flavobacterium sp. J27]